jgi:hypothetical protein
MNKRPASLLAAIILVCATPLFGQTRTWVSGVGSDANPCSRTAPCQTFAGAISKTGIGGEINCLDPAGYGTVNITKSITIDCNWTHGSILAASTNGVIVNGSNIVVTLRGLSINGAGTTTGNGIRILQAAAVNVDNVTLENFGGTAVGQGRGISIETASANMRVTVQNSRIWNASNHGIHSIPTGGNVLLVVDHTQISRGGTVGMQLNNNTNATIDNSAITHHASGSAVTLEASTVTAHISNSLLAHNSVGIFNGVGGGAPTARIYGNVITANTAAAFAINAGSVISYGNNAIRGNVGSEAPTGAATGTQ